MISCHSCTCAGKLDLSELQTYIEYSEARLGSQSSPLAEMYASLSALVAARPTGSQQAEFEEFVDLVRAQVAAMEGTKGWIKTQVSNVIALPKHAFPRLISEFVRNISDYIHHNFTTRTHPLLLCLTLNPFPPVRFPPNP